MNPEDAENWKEEALIEVFRSLSAHPRIQSMLVFKGARVLQERLQELGRRSLDIDCNLLLDFVQSTPEHSAQRLILENEMSKAVSRYFENQTPIRFSLKRVRVRPQPPDGHPLGWDGYDVKFSIIDHSRTQVRGLPSLTLDIAAPETLSTSSVAPLIVGGATILAYTLERIAGEKLRAFLSSLPHYRAKIARPGVAVRVKDLHDLARIARARPLSDQQFWREVGNEFERACRSRYIDCAGLRSFEQALDTTQSSYENDPTLPNAILFHEAWNNIRELVGFLEAERIIPFEFPLN